MNQHATGASRSTGQPCRHCAGELKMTFADLGLQPPANSYLSDKKDFAGERVYPLHAKVCSACRLVQIDYDVPPSELFHNYAYFSSFSDSWLTHARNYAHMAAKRFRLDGSKLVVELASNDGYLLKNFCELGIPVLGIDPSDTVAAAAEKIGVPTLVEFFGKAVAEGLVKEGRKADLIIANNVLAHVPALNDFVSGIATLLAEDGTLTVEFPHLLRLIEHVEFDTIYHEHFSYFSLLAVERVLGRHGLRVFDVEELPTHGGSLRIFACHAGRSGVSEGAGLLKVRADEAAARLDEDATYQSFAQRVQECRKSLRDFMGEAKKAGRSVVAYGAAAKGNTLLNFCGIDHADISMVADRNPHKQGKFLPGSHIPIVSPDDVLAAHADYVLILPWNLREEIIKQLAAIRDHGGKFVTPVPNARVWS
jgi:SAM-dependent methyltransferase